MFSRVALAAFLLATACATREHADDPTRQYIGRLGLGPGIPSHGSLFLENLVSGDVLSFLGHCWVVLFSTLRLLVEVGLYLFMSRGVAVTLGLVWLLLPWWSQRRTRASDLGSVAAK